MKFIALVGAAYIASTVLGCRAAHAFGDEGHEVIGLIAEHYLTPAVRTRVKAMLSRDDSALVAHDIAHESTWADKYRDSDRDTSKVRYRQTRNWHFVDLELQGADLYTACFQLPRLPVGEDASSGPAQDCVTDKIDEFSAELRSRNTSDRERLLALQFLLHLIGDVHQPLHASDDHDQGGNRKIVSAPGIAANSLHHYWDTEFVARLGANETEIADQLISKITASERRQWSSGTPGEWAMESYSVSKAHAYGALPPTRERERYMLPETYIADATLVTGQQLSKAGVRLAFVLNQALN
jgi:S1/P1 Nuclease